MTPRVNQQKLIDFSGGFLGVSAVPGSGKTWTLSRLAAKLILDRKLNNDQKVLIVTYSNSAVDNFARHINLLIKEAGLLPGFGYRVQTLHSISHKIVRDRPGIAGVSEDFKIVDEVTSQLIVKKLVDAWLQENQTSLDGYLDPPILENENWKTDTLERQLKPLLYKVANNTIKYAKDRLYSQSVLDGKLQVASIKFPIVFMLSSIFKDYQKSLAYRGALDFSDLNVLAHKIISNEKEYLEFLKSKWPYILEDEAQDSDNLQQMILSLIAGANGNWVRVGDPNQAIFETFTTSNPKYLRDFIQVNKSIDLPQSGRSSQPIIDLANHLISWSETNPTENSKNALSRPFILPTEPGDTQSNPEVESTRIIFHDVELSPEQELELVVRSCEEFVNQKPGKTAAVLVSSNDRGGEVVKRLQDIGITAIDNLLRSTLETRKVAGALVHILLYLSDSTSAKRLSVLYKIWKKLKTELSERDEVVVASLDSIKHVEAYIYPIQGETIDPGSLTIAGLEEFTLFVKRWLSLKFLPIDQIVHSLAMDLFVETEKLALSFKFARLLKSAATDNPEWGLLELAEELKLISQNQRKFIGFSTDDTDFDPDKYKDQIVVSTIHKAKGLEWDRVYLMGANNYAFPSGALTDSFSAEKKFIRNRLNLQAETQSQIDSLFTNSDYLEGLPTGNARNDLIREKIRLFYVAISRAKTELIVTWNKGDWGRNTASIAFSELANFVNTNK